MKWDGSTTLLDGLVKLDSNPAGLFKSGTKNLKFVVPVSLIQRKLIDTGTMVSDSTEKKIFFSLHKKLNDYEAAKGFRVRHQKRRNLVNSDSVRLPQQEY